MQVQVMHGVVTSASLSKIRKKNVLDTSIQKMFFYRMKMITFWGDLNDISAAKEALVVAQQIFIVCTIEMNAWMIEVFNPRSTLF